MWSCGLMGYRMATRLEINDVDNVGSKVKIT
jgi:hypothetical protein